MRIPDRIMRDCTHWRQALRGRTVKDHQRSSATERQKLRMIGQRSGTAPTVSSFVSRLPRPVCQPGL